MLPPSLDDWLPANHLARFIAEIVEQLDLSEIYRAYEKDGRGQAAYHPLMMVKLLLYGYCVGVNCSRKMERATYDSVAFRYLAANQHPDHTVIAEFRRRHLVALGRLFFQALKLCQAAGLVKKQRLPDGHQFYLSGRALGFDGKYYMATPSRRTWSMDMFVYDPLQEEASTRLGYQVDVKSE